MKRRQQKTEGEDTASQMDTKMNEKPWDTVRCDGCGGAGMRLVAWAPNLYHITVYFGTKHVSERRVTWAMTNKGQEEAYEKASTSKHVG